MFNLLNISFLSVAMLLGIPNADAQVNSKHNTPDGSEYYAFDGDKDLEGPDETRNLLAELEITSDYYPKITITPNPFDVYALVEFSNPEDLRFDMLIFDVDGHQVRAYEDVHSSLIVIEKNDLVPGEYTYRLACENGDLYLGRFYIE